MSLWKGTGGQGGCASPGVGIDGAEWTCLRAGPSLRPYKIPCLHKVSTTSFFHPPPLQSDFDTFGSTRADAARAAARREAEARPSLIPGGLFEDLVVPVAESLGKRSAVGHTSRGSWQCTLLELAVLSSRSSIRQAAGLRRQ